MKTLTLEGTAVHKRLDETYRYQIEVPFESYSRYLGVTRDVVNKSRQLPLGFIAAHPADEVYVTADILVVA
jgi:hypothetical protein